MATLDQYLRVNRIRGGDFAGLVGIHPTSLSKMRRGRQTPTLAQAFAIEKASGGAVPAASWLDTMLAAEAA